MATNTKENPFQNNPFQDAFAKNPFAQGFEQFSKSNPFTDAMKNNPFTQSFGQKNPFADFTKFAGDFSKVPSMPSFDFGKVMTAQRKNVEALAEAGQHVANTSQALARKQMETMRANFEQAMNTSREMMTSKSSETNVARQAEMAKELYEDAMASLREISEAASKTSFDAFDKLQRRAAESISELQAATGMKK